MAYFHLGLKAMHGKWYLFLLITGIHEGQPKPKEREIDLTSWLGINKLILEKKFQEGDFVFIKSSLK